MVSLYKYQNKASSGDRNTYSPGGGDIMNNPGGGNTMDNPGGGATIDNPGGGATDSFTG